MAKYLPDGAIGFAIGAFVQWDESSKKWTVTYFEDDLFYDGESVGDVEGKPFIGEQEHDY